MSGMCRRAGSDEWGRRTTRSGANSTTSVRRCRAGTLDTTSMPLGTPRDQGGPAHGAANRRRPARRRSGLVSSIEICLAASRSPSKLRVQTRRLDLGNAGILTPRPPHEISLLCPHLQRHGHQLVDSLHWKLHGGAHSDTVMLRRGFDVGARLVGPLTKAPSTECISASTIHQNGCSLPVSLGAVSSAVSITLSVRCLERTQKKVRLVIWRP
jgi:hypothetical protein